MAIFLIGCRANKCSGQVQQSNYNPLVLKFYVLILIYFWAPFIWFWFLYFFYISFILLWWNACITLFHECFACVLSSFEYRFNSLLLTLLMESVLRFPALLPSILLKLVIWILLLFNWLVVIWCKIWVWGISEQIINSFIFFLFLFTCSLLLYSSFACIFSVSAFLDIY